MEGVFDRHLTNACPIATTSHVSVDLTNAGDEYELKPSPDKRENNIFIYELSPKNKNPLDIRLTWNQDYFIYRKT